MERSETVDSLFPLCCHRFINYPRKEGGARSTWLNVRRGFYESWFRYLVTATADRCSTERD